LAMDQERQQVVVRVLDKQTNNVVRQLPSRQMVDLVKQMRDLEGVLFKASS
jgi:flagellar protein FlaG